MKHRRPTRPPQKPKASRALTQVELELVTGGAFPFIQTAVVAPSNDNR